MRGPVKAMRAGISRIIGPPPEQGAARVEVLRWIRRFYALGLATGVPVMVLALLLAGGATAVYIPVGLGALIWLQGFITVNVQIRRAQQQPDQTGHS
jgi:hypothetical protein